MTLPRRTPSKPDEPVLPWPLSTRPSGCSPGAEVRAAAVVLEAGQHARRTVLVEAHLDRDVADEPRPVRRADRLEVDEAEAGDLACARLRDLPLTAGRRAGIRAQLVAVAEELEPPAHAEHDRAARRRLVQRLALGRDEVDRAQALVAILAAAEVEEVVRVGVDRLAQPRRRHPEADPAPRAAALEHEQVAAVGVDVHEVGVQRADAQLSHGASPPSSRRAPRSAG